MRITGWTRDQFRGFLNSIIENIFMIRGFDHQKYQQFKMEKMVSI